MALIIKNTTSKERLWCQSCSTTIVPGDEIRVFLWDGNPGGTGPVQHASHDKEAYLGRFRDIWQNVPAIPREFAA